MTRVLELRVVCTDATHRKNCVDMYAARAYEYDPEGTQLHLLRAVRNIKHERATLMLSWREVPLPI